MAIEGGKEEKIALYQKIGGLWRFLALVQIPITTIAVILAISWYIGADTVLDVPERYESNLEEFESISDTEFINTAIRFVNLVFTYQPATVRDQFAAAAQLVVEPARATLNLEAQARTIEESGQSQVFRIEPRQISLEREDEKQTAIVRLPGVTEQFTPRIDSRPLFEEAVYYLTFGTEKQEGMPSRIVLRGIRAREVPLRVLEEEDRAKAATATSQRGKKRSGSRSRHSSGKHKPPAGEP